MENEKIIKALQLIYEGKIGKEEKLEAMKILLNTVLDTTENKKKQGQVQELIVLIEEGFLYRKEPVKKKPKKRAIQKKDTTKQLQISMDFTPYTHTHIQTEKDMYEHGELKLFLSNLTADAKIILKLITSEYRKELVKDATIKNYTFTISSLLELIGIDKQDSHERKRMQASLEMLETKGHEILTMRGENGQTKAVLTTLLYVLSCVREGCKEYENLKQRTGYSEPLLYRYTPVAESFFIEKELKKNGAIFIPTIPYARLYADTSIRGASREIAHQAMDICYSNVNYSNEEKYKKEIDEIGKSKKVMKNRREKLIEKTTPYFVEGLQVVKKKKE